jgi:outer membrane protein assembly factor BamB
MTKLRKQLAALFLSAISASAVFADVPKDSKDWPQFRGPARDNISKETGLLKEWPKEGPPLAWTAKGIGDGHASVAVTGGKIYTTGSDGSAVMAYALNESDGKEAWHAKIGGLGNNRDDQGGKGSRSTPTVDGDMVYVEGPVGDVVALSAADGKEAWRVNLARDFGGGVPQWGYSDSPLVDGDNLLCIPGGSRGTVVALNKKTGKQVWRTADFDDPAHYTSLVAADIGGVHQAVILTPESVAAIDAKTGNVLWKVERRGEVAVCPSPIVHDNYVYVTSGYGVGCDLFKIISEGGKFSVEPVYTHKKIPFMENHHGGVIYLDGYIYGFSDSKKKDVKSKWICQDFMTGQVKWAAKESVGKGTISYADGHFYIRDEGKGTIALIEASPTAYKEISHFTPPDLSHKPYWPHMVITNGKLYVRDMDTLLCYDIKAK